MAGAVFGRAVPRGVSELVLGLGEPFGGVMGEGTPATWGRGDRLLQLGRLTGKYGGWGRWLFPGGPVWGGGWEVSQRRTFSSEGFFWLAVGSSLG